MKMKRHKINCGECGSVFDTALPHRVKHCSEKCRNEARKKAIALKELQAAKSEMERIERQRLVKSSVAQAKTDIEYALKRMNLQQSK
jgi:hypothetical protein